MTMGGSAPGSGGAKGICGIRIQPDNALLNVNKFLSGDSLSACPAALGT